MQVGPLIRMPWSAMWAGIGAATVVAAIGLVIVRIIRPAGMLGVGFAWVAVVGAFLVATVATRPWKPRPIGQLLMAWLGGRGICFAAALLLGTLLYFAPQSPPDPLAMGLVLVASYFAALLVESAVMSRWLRAPRGTSTESGPAHGSVSRG
ncbi:MAG: hypothetical protein IBJ10_08440 [Phycisphaerales bacterium]|nr:hypothetical protein [Phycisphaerales bacterium]